MVSEVKKGQRSWGQVLAQNSRNKANIARQKNITFEPPIAFATLRAILLQLNGMFMMWKNTASTARQSHPGHQNSSLFHPVIGLKEFIQQNLQPAYEDLGWKNRDLGN